MIRAVQMHSQLWTWLLADRYRGQWTRAGIFVPALFCSHRVAWVQLSWLHYGVLKSIGRGNESKPGPSMARNRCYRLPRNTLFLCFKPTLLLQN